MNKNDLEYLIHLANQHVEKANKYIADPSRDKNYWTGRKHEAEIFLTAATTMKVQNVEET